MNLIFHEMCPPRGWVTKRWTVFSAQGAGVELGIVSWFAPWRRYTFSPKSETTFDQACLGELADFLRKETQCRIAERT